jgi:hypothetical protein
MAGLITSGILSKDTLVNFQNNIVTGKHIDWSYADKFTSGDDAIGNTYNIRLPIQVSGTLNNMAWTGGTAGTTSPSSSNVEPRVALTIDSTLTVPMTFSGGDLALKIGRFSERYVQPTTRYMANLLDLQIAQAVTNCSIGTSGNSDLGTSAIVSTGAGTGNTAGYVVGTYGTALTPTTFLQAKKVLFDRGCPQDGELYAVLSSQAQLELNLAQATLFNPLMSADELYRKGLIGVYAGVKVSASQNVASHTNGAQTTLVPAAGTTLTSGWSEFVTATVTTTTQAINAGDVFQASGVFLLNPITKQPTNLPFQAIAQATYASGVTSVKLFPAPIVSGPYRNVSATVDSVSLALVGAAGGSANSSGSESFLFHKKAIAAASPDFAIPKKSSLDMAEIIKDDEMDGFSLRFIRDFDSVGWSSAFGGGVGTGASGFVARYDSMFGIKTVRPEWIVRIRN